MTIIVDATSLILLAKVGVLEIFVDRNDVVATKTVYEEVVKGKDKGRADSLLVEKLVQQGTLKVKLPAESVKSGIEKLFNMGAGELEVISLAYNTANTILSDDRKCLNAARALGIGFMTSLDVIIVMCRKGAIDKESAKKCLDGLEEYGWYGKSLIKRYREGLK